MAKIDQKKLALIHIIKKELNLSDDAYRGILLQAAGVGSAKELDGAGFRKLMNYFVRSSYYQVNRYGLTMKQKLYIRYLVEKLSWTPGHFSNFIRKYYHKPQADELTRREAGKLIESLKAVLAHQESATP